MTDKDLLFVILIILSGIFTFVLIDMDKDGLSNSVSHHSESLSNSGKAMELSSR